MQVILPCGQRCPLPTRAHHRNRDPNCRRLWTQPALLTSVPKRAWFGYVRERDQRETERGPKWASGPVLVVRTNGSEGPHSAGCGQRQPRRKECLTWGDWRSDRNCRQTLYGLFSKACMLTGESRAHVGGLPRSRRGGRCAAFKAVFDPDLEPGATRTSWAGNTCSPEPDLHY
jgi:hypothetical protein